MMWSETICKILATLMNGRRHTALKTSSPGTINILLVWASSVMQEQTEISAYSAWWIIVFESRAAARRSSEQADASGGGVTFKKTRCCLERGMVALIGNDDGSS